MAKRWPNAGAFHMATPSKTIPIGTSSTPVASLVSKTLCAPYQEYWTAGRSPGGVLGQLGSDAFGRPNATTTTKEPRRQMAPPNPATPTPWA